MAVGTISSPSTWYLRQVVTHTWCQSVQDTVNNCYAFKGATQYMWLGPAQMMKGSSANASTAMTDGDPHYWSCAGVADKIICSAPLFGTSSTVRAKLTEVVAHVYQAGAAGMTLNAKRVSGMNVASGPSNASLGTTSGAASSGEKLLTISGLTSGGDDDSYIRVELVSATANDRVYGVRLKFDLSLYV